MAKADVRAIASELGLGVAGKPDSQDICFVPNGDYRAVVRQLRPEASIPGELVDRDGRVLGQHDGIVGFTVGQRRGLALGGNAEPLYVLAIDAATRRVTVGPREALAVRSARLSEINWIGALPDAPLTARVRSTARPASAWINGDKLHFAAPEYGVSPGQAAVIYAGDRMIGGGWIEETYAVEAVAA